MPSGLLAFNGRSITILVHCLNRDKEERSEGEADKHILCQFMPAPSSSLRIAVKIPKIGTRQENLTYPLLDQNIAFRSLGTARCEPQRPCRGVAVLQRDVTQSHLKTSGRRTWPPLRLLAGQTGLQGGVSRQGDIPGQRGGGRQASVWERGAAPPALPMVLASAVECSTCMSTESKNKMTFIRCFKECSGM